jgi:type IV secretion system protein VirB1
MSSKVVQNQRFPVQDAYRPASGGVAAIRTGGTCWPRSSRKQTCERVLGTADRCSARSSLRGAQRNSSSICAVTGFEAGASGSSALGAVYLATEALRTFNRPGASFGNSTSLGASRSTLWVIWSCGSSSALLRWILESRFLSPTRFPKALWSISHTQANRSRSSLKAGGLVTLLGLVASHLALAAPLSIRDFGELALRCGPSVAPSTLASVARTESAFEPFAINDNTTRTSGVPATRDIAIQLASKLLEAGHSVDVGIMQINSGNFQKLGLTLEGAFDPCKSVAAAATVLTGDFVGGGETHGGQQAAVRVAISKYNTGDAQRGFDNGYVHKVELAARRIVPALDVGRPTAAIDSAPLPAAAALAPRDPNAPPAWDVWASFDYEAAHRQVASASTSTSVEPGSSALSDAGKGPTAAVTVSGPSNER